MRTVSAGLAILSGGACGPPTDRAADTLTVFAAASLTEPFTELGAAFEARNPGADVAFTFAASSTLVAQITNGAPADVVATADTATMQRLVDSDVVDGELVVVARNRLTVVVGRDNPRAIRSVADLGAPDLVVVLAAPQVPIGAYSAEVLRRAGVSVTPRSLEADPKAVVAKVRSGEADAGIVYVTDVRAAGGAVAGVPIPDDLNVVASYPIARTRDASDAAAAQAFIEFVRSPEGRAILLDAGFLAP